MEEVFANSCTLSLPVKPDTTCTIMEMIISNDNVDSSMEFDAADFRTCKISLVINMMNVVVFDD